MRSRALTFVGVLLAFSALPLLAGAVLYEKLDPHLGLEWVHDSFALKDAAAAKITGPKIVLVGGSAIHFSLEAERIGKLLGQPALNYGSHAALLPYYHLHRVKTVLNPGDTVIIGIEYENFFSGKASSPWLRAFARNYDPSYPLAEGRYFSDAVWPALRAEVTPYPPFSWATWIAQAWSLNLANPEGFTPTNAYDAAKISAWGDATQKRVEGVPASIRTRLRESLKGPAFAVAPISPDLAPELIKFAEWARARNITVLATWTPRLDNPSLRTPADQTFFRQVRETYALAGIDVLGEPEDMFFPLEDTLDTAYHMNSVGAAEASARFAKLLQDYRSSHAPR